MTAYHPAHDPAFPDAAIAGKGDSAVGILAQSIGGGGGTGGFAAAGAAAFNGAASVAVGGGAVANLARTVPPPCPQGAVGLDGRQAGVELAQ